MGRSVSSVYDEIKRNRVRRSYHPQKAQHKAYIRRKYAKYQGMIIAENSELQAFVEAGLYDDLSPEAIAGRIKYHKKHLRPASKDSIRRYIKSVYGRRVEYYRKKKKARRYRRAKSQKLTDRVFIDKRPEYINKRQKIGHAESDFLVSGKSGSGVILNVTDRKSRATFLELIRQVNIENVHQAFLRIKARFPELKTATTDNDILMRRHKELEKRLDIKIYFCNPYASWQKGTVENSNKYVRRDIPKGSNLSKYSEKFIQNIENKLNRRPLECLSYRTPQEVLNGHRKRKKHLTCFK